MSVFFGIGIGILLGVIIGIAAGMLASNRMQKSYILKTEKDLKDSENAIFTEIIESIDSGRVKFINRVNDSAAFGLLIPTMGKIEIIYFLDKIDIAIFQRGFCVRDSGNVDEDLVSEICLKLNSKFYKDINDVTNIMGNIVDNKTLKKVSGVWSSASISGFGLPQIETEIEEVFNVDEILDQISKGGIESLSKGQREFLDNLENDN